MQKILVDRTKKVQLLGVNITIFVIVLWFLGRDLKLLSMKYILLTSPIFMQREQYKPTKKEFLEKEKIIT